MRRLLLQSLLSVAVASSLTGCGSDNATDTNASNVKVVNGKTLAATDYPSVVLLYDAKLGAMCTGTFINATTVISAAHCTEGGTVDANGKVSGSLAIISVKDLAKGEASLVATSTSMVRNRLWDSNGKNVNKYDLSLITFPAGTAAAVSSFASASPKSGAALTIVGYGLNQSKNLSGRFVGGCQTHRCEHGGIRQWRIHPI